MAISAQWELILRSCACEFAGCFFINLLGCGAAIATGEYGYYLNPLDRPIANETEAEKSNQFFYGEDYHMVVALAFGIVFVAATAIFARVSGAHFNPSVTIGCLVIRKVNLFRGLLYIPSQVLGCLAGSGLLLAITPPLHFRSDVFVPVVNELHGGKLWQAIVWEFILTFLRTLVYLVIIRDPADLARATSPLLIGVTIMLIHMTAVYSTTGSCNPARAIGAAVVSNHYKNIWVFIVISPAGGICGALAHYIFFMELQKHGEEDQFIKTTLRKRD